MATYKIETRHIILGEYSGATELDALNACAQDAGYKSWAEACETVGVDPTDWASSAFDFRAGRGMALVTEV